MIGKQAQNWNRLWKGEREREIQNKEGCGMRKQEETSIDGALQRSVGECGYGQIRIYLLVRDLRATWACWMCTICCWVYVDGNDVGGCVAG